MNHLDMLTTAFGPVLVWFPERGVPPPGVKAWLLHIPTTDKSEWRRQILDIVRDNQEEGVKFEDCLRELTRMLDRTGKAWNPAYLNQAYVLLIKAGAIQTENEWGEITP